MKTRPLIISTVVAALYFAANLYWTSGGWLRKEGDGVDIPIAFQIGGFFFFRFPFGFVPGLHSILTSGVLNALFWSALTWLVLTKRLRIPKVLGLLTLMVAVLCALVWYSFYRPLHQLDTLERNAKKVITASELQQWAVDLLAKYPPGSNAPQAELGKSIPPQLKTLCT